MEQFLAQVPVPRREIFRRIVDEHLSRPGCSVDHNAKAAIALRIAKPGDRGTVAALTLFTDGSSSLNRGYLVSCLAGDDLAAFEAAFDEEILSAFPEAVAGEKRYYWRIADLRPEGVAQFVDWVSRLFSTGVLPPEVGA